MAHPSFSATTDGMAGPELRGRWIALVFSMGGGLQSQIRRSRSSVHGLAIVLAGVWLSTAWEPARLQAATEDWQWRIRQLVQVQQLSTALAIAEDRLGEHPEDVEARGWRARLLAWTDRWNESEIEYQTVLQSAPHDTDILVGLADVLIWQGRPAEAITLLDQASVLDAGRNDVQLRRGRLLHALERRAEAGAAYARVLSLDGLSVGVKGGLPILNAESLDEGYGSPPFNFVGGRDSFELGGQWRPSPGSTSEMKNGFYRRFGHAAIRWDATGSRPTSWEFRSGGCPQASNRMNYAIRF